MSILNKKEILEKIKSKEIEILPELDLLQIQTHAIDLRLGYTFLIPKRWQLTNNGREAISLDYFSAKNKNNFEVIELEKGQFFDLLPGEFVMASTFETIKLPNNIMSILYPRSSTNRRGLSVDLTGIIDAGYQGQLVIPIRNNAETQTVRLYPGERFCQITFNKLSEEADPYEGRYKNKDIIEGFIRKHNESDEDEQQMITKGEIRELKDKFKIKFDEE